MATAEEAPAGTAPGGGGGDELGTGSSPHRSNTGEALTDAPRLPALKTGAADSDGLRSDSAALPAGAGAVGAIGQGRANFENQFQPVPQVKHNANGDDSLAAVGDRPQLAENGGLLSGEGSANAAAEIAPGSPQTAPRNASPASAVGEDFHTILGASPDGVGVPCLPSGGGAGGTLGAERLGDDAGQLPPADRAGVASAAGVGGDIFKMSPFQANVTGPTPSDSDAPDLDSEDQAGDNWVPEYVLDQKKLFEVTSCGCTLPKWKGVEWRAQENGHRCLWYVGLGVSATGKTTKRRRYGRYYTHRAIKLFVEGEYANELNTFEQRQSFGKPKRRAKA